MYPFFFYPMKITPNVPCRTSTTIFNNLPTAFGGSVWAHGPSYMGLPAITRAPVGLKSPCCHQMMTPIHHKKSQIWEFSTANMTQKYVRLQRPQLKPKPLRKGVLKASFGSNRNPPQKIHISGAKTGGICTLHQWGIRGRLSGVWIFAQIDPNFEVFRGIIHIFGSFSRICG